MSRRWSVTAAADNPGPPSTAACGPKYAIHSAEHCAWLGVVFPAPLLPEVVGMNAKDLLGQQGEELAAAFLGEAGLIILERNWRCTQGEIDIVAVDGRTLVICEVKTRSSVRFGAPVEAITRQKAFRLRKLAILWVRAHGLIFEAIRIDIVGVLRAASGDVSIEHVRGVG
jgi:putative endonuclease